MKFLIWLGFGLAWGLIQTILKECGILLGALPTVVLLTVLWIPADCLSKAWDIKRYKKKFRLYIVDDMIRIIDLCKKGFLIKKKFNIQDDGVDFFDTIKAKIKNMSAKEINNIMVQIMKFDSSPVTYTLGLLDSESIERVIKGDVSEIIKQNGNTYTISKIYEYVNDIQLEKGMITPVQHINKITRIDRICEEKSK